MLSGLPSHVDWDCQAYEAVVFHLDMGFLSEAVLKSSSEPWVHEAGNVYGCCCDEVVPWRLSVAAGGTHLVTNCFLPRCEGVVAVPEKHYDEYDDSEEMRCLEELVTEMPATR